MTGGRLRIAQRRYDSFQKATAPRLILLLRTELIREMRGCMREAILHSREDIQLLCFGLNPLASSLSVLRRQINILIAVVIVIAIITMLHGKF
jgi:hypothetical protein